MTLFTLGQFTSHSGAVLPFKIDCDALTDDDIDCCAVLIARMVRPFIEVEGVPSGGVRLADALMAHRRNYGGLLIVDDVWTTGGSMNAHRTGREAEGAVIFARGPLEPWVRSIFLHRNETDVAR